MRQKLQRNRSSESDVLGFVHLSHAAGAEAFADAVVLNGGTNQ